MASVRRLRRKIWEPLRLTTLCASTACYSDIAFGYKKGCEQDYGARDSVVVKALSYKPEGHWFETRRGEYIF
jgi:hypothetical protein